MHQQVYFDYCATTPVHPTVKEAMLPALGELFGNPSSLHWAGQRAVEAIQTARNQVASLVGVSADEAVFTSGATEANNMALLGVMTAYEPGKAHLITTQIEHHAVLHTAHYLEHLGYDVTYLPVDSDGVVDPDAVKAAIRPDTVMVSVMMVNNEVGSIQPIAAISQITQEHGILLHSDIVQAVGLLDADRLTIDADLLVLTAHKLYGPKGIGALIIREGVTLNPLLHGGSQERKRRAGTENVPGIVGFGAATDLMYRHKQEEVCRLRTLRERLIAAVHDAIINCPPDKASPHILSISFPGVDAEMLLLRLNMNGIAASMGSACTSESMELSHVLVAMGLPMAQIESTLRFSLGLPTTLEEVDYLAHILQETTEQCRVQGA